METCSKLKKLIRNFKYCYIISNLSNFRGIEANFKDRQKILKLKSNKHETENVVSDLKWTDLNKIVTSAILYNNSLFIF